MDEDTKFLNKLQSDFEKYPEFPKEVQDWIIKAIKAKVRSEFLRKLQESPHEMITNLDDFFKLMRQILNCDNKTLMRGTDFNSADLNPERLHSMLAELRGVGFLYNQGFTHIKLIGASRTQRCADIVASHNSILYAVEVLCSSRTAYRYPNHKKRSSDLIIWMVDKYIEKTEQLNQTSTKENCTKHVLVVVLDSSPAKESMTKHEYVQVLKQAWEKLGQPPDTHVALVAGMETCFGLDDCVYPPLPENP